MKTKMLLLPLLFLPFLGCDGNIEKTLKDKHQSMKPAAVAVPKPDAPAIPYELKGFRTGMPIEEFNKLSKVIEDTNSSKYHKTYWIKSTLADIKTKYYIRFEDYGDGLILNGITIHFDKSDYDTIKATIIEKYGEPSNRKEVKKSNAMGASWTGEELTWDNKISSILLEELGGKVGISDLSLAYLDAKGRISTYDMDKNNKRKKDI